VSEPRSYAQGYLEAQAKYESENGDLKSYLKQYRDNEAGLLQRIVDLRSWIKAANQFAWAHERDCPRRVSDDACACGLDEFLGRPRPFIESYQQRISELEGQLEAKRVKVANLSAFFREGIEISFDGGDWCGSDIQDKAEELGLIREEKYDPEKHSALGSFEGDSGDSIYIINDEERGESVKRRRLNRE
jgi:hypothetical protein